MSSSWSEISWIFIFFLQKKKSEHSRGFKIDFTKKKKIHDFHFWLPFLEVEISNQRLKVGMSRNRKNLIFVWPHFSAKKSCHEQFPIIRKMFRGREHAENRFLLQLFVGFLCQNHQNWCIFDDFPAVVIISKLVGGGARVHKNRKNPKSPKMG